MSVEAPVITVVIPTYRRPALLRRAIRSVQQQSHAQVRIAVYDNASGDGTREAVLAMAEEDPRIQYHEHAENIGSTPNFQFGLERVETPYWAFLSDDDVLLPGCYEAAMRGFAEHPEAGFSCARVVNVDETGEVNDGTRGWRPGLHRPPGGLLNMLLEGIPIWTGIVWRREVRDAIGVLDMATSGSPDTDYEVRAAIRCAYVLRPEIGAVFSSRSVRMEGSLRPFDFAWPSQYLTVEKVREDRTLPPEVREEAVRLLEDHFSRGLFVAALQYAYHGRHEEARRALELLRTKPRNGARVAFLTSLLPAARSGLTLAGFRWLVDARRKLRTRRASTSRLEAELREAGWPPPDSGTGRPGRRPGAAHRGSAGYDAGAAGNEAA